LTKQCTHLIWSQTKRFKSWVLHRIVYHFSSSTQYELCKWERRLYSICSLILSQLKDLRLQVNSQFRGLNKSMSKSILNLLEPINVNLWKVVVQRIIVVMFGVEQRWQLVWKMSWLFWKWDMDGYCEFTNTLVARLRKCGIRSEK